MPARSRSPDVDAYVAAAPAGQRAALAEMRALVREHLPEAEEGMSPNGFAVYAVGGRWIAGFASRAKGPMLYVMAEGVLDRHERTLGTLRHGRSCVAWKPSKTLSHDDLRDLAGRMLGDAARGA